MTLRCFQKHWFTTRNCVSPDGSGSLGLQMRGPWFCLPLLLTTALLLPCEPGPGGSQGAYLGTAPLPAHIWPVPVSSSALAHGPTGRRSRAVICPAVNKAEGAALSWSAVARELRTRASGQDDPAVKQLTEPRWSVEVAAPALGPGGRARTPVEKGACPVSLRILLLPTLSR